MAVSQQNQPQEPRINGGASGQPPLSSRTTPLPTATVATATATATTTTLSEELNTASKRQRRPSVRLVEIGDQPAAALTKHWRQQHQHQQQQQLLSSINNANTNNNNRVSKTRVLTNLGGFDEGDNKEGKSDFESDNLSIGSWKQIKGKPSKRDLKRPRTNWVSKKIQHHHHHKNGEEDDDDEEEDDEDGNGFSRDFEIEGSESPLKEQQQNPVHDERNLQFRGRARIGGDDGVDLDVHDDDNGGQNSARRWGGGEGDGDGIRAWLDGLGLGRYSPVFEFHEVDEEVLPLLTLEDLKDMGIHAVGSRRKIFCAIQKLNKGFS